MMVMRDHNAAGRPTAPGVRLVPAQPPPSLSEARRRAALSKLQAEQGQRAGSSKGRAGAAGGGDTDGAGAAGGGDSSAKG